MKQNIDANVSRAFTILRNNEEWKTVRAFIEQWLKDQDKHNRRLAGDSLSQGQGVAQCLEQLLKDAEESPAIWEKLKANAQRVQLRQA